MPRFPSIIVTSLITLAATALPARADEPSPAAEPANPSASPAVSPFATTAPSSSPEPSASAAPSVTAARPPKPAPSVAASPVPSLSASPSPSGPTKEDLAALALIEEMDALLPDIEVNGDTPMERLERAADSIRLLLVEVEGRLAGWLAGQQAASSRLADAQQRLEAARVAVAQAEEAVREHAGDFYMGPAWADTVVLAAGSLEDAGRAHVYVAALLGDDVDLIEALRVAQAQVERERDEAEAAAEALSRAGVAIRQERAVLDLLGQKMRAVLNQVVRSFGSGSMAFARLIAAAQKEQASAPLLERFVFAPVGGRISSPFGPRVHPIYGYRSMHTGTDIAASAGTPVVVPRNGIVLASGDAGPFGLSIVIDHGGTIATVLSHLSSSVVEEGDHVRAGQVVGFVGCTGWCTGPHLHFEVWFGGAAQNPVPWMIVGPGRVPDSSDGPPVSLPSGQGDAAETLAGLRDPLADLSARP